MGNKYIQIFTTAASKKEAEKIAEVLVREKLAGCAQVLGPVRSTYRWKGKMEKSKEWLCIIKSVEKNFGKIEKTIKSLHSYKLPEIIVLPIINGSKEYLNWLKGQT